MPTLRVPILAFIFCVAATTLASAQAVSDFHLTSATQERLGENHIKLIGAVELEQKDMKLYADELDYFSDEDRAVATGNVVFTQGNNRIAADRADFNVKTRLGTFYGASGIASVQPPRRTPGAPGAFAPPMPTSSTDTDVYFFGEVVEKVGARRYKITNGGFSTCVQPTPRWNLNADTVLLNIDHYTVLKNAVFNVKGVPMLYLPVLYYPTKKEDRATGFLIPTYGASSLRGQAIHNAFFWAIDRSQDATFMYDWYSKAGQGYGSEYRYNAGGGSDGTVSAELLDQSASASSSGNLPATTAFEVRGVANQTLPGHMRLRARADYFSDLKVNQTFNTNVYDASRNSRIYGANVVGAWRTFSLNGTYDYNEYFYGSDPVTGVTNSGVLGNSPRIALARNERPIFGTAPLYFSTNTEFVHLDRYNKTGDLVHDDSSLGRFDFLPQVRYPFKRWQWFTVNSSLGWRDTFYSRSYDITNVNKPVIDDNLNRTYFTAQAQIVGPVFTRIFNTPDNGYAERFKHTIEPFMNVQRTSAIDDFARIVQIDSVDTVVGNTTNYTYGINNRFYAKRRSSVQGRPSQATQILSVELVQTYYTSPLASQYDTRYQTSFGAAQPNNFSPVALSVTATPANALNATVRMEFDSKYKELRTISSNVGYNWSGRIQSQIGWSKRFYIAGLSGFDNPAALDHYLNVTTNAHTLDNRYGIIHSFNYNILYSSLLQQRISGFYNTQCCGIAMEYQTYNYAGPNAPGDHRFFLSFTLAGLGNFSPFNGAMSGVPR